MTLQEAARNYQSDAPQYHTQEYVIKQEQTYGKENFMKACQKARTEKFAYVRWDESELR